MNKNITNTKGKIDWMITLVPLGIVIALCILFFLLPDQSNAVLSQIRFFFGDTFGTYYLVIGLGIFLLSLYIAGSKYGDIVLGEKGEKPKYSFFSWGAMMFTCGLAADILFYSFSEWVLYATDPHLEEMGSIQEWAGVYPLFHWSFIPWGFYLYWLWHSVLCSMYEKETARNTLKPAVQSWGNIPMAGQEESLIFWLYLPCLQERQQPSVWQHR